MRHNGSISQSLPANAWTFDESRPLLYQVSGFRLEADGELVFDALDTEWAQRPAFDQLETQQNNGQHETPTMATRFSNDGYLRFTRIAPGEKVRFSIDADRTARCILAELETTDGQFATHFPLGTRVEWFSPGRIRIIDGLIEPGSHLADVAKLIVDFDGSCPNDDCGPAGGAVEKIEISPNSNVLQLTSDGGLQAPGTIAPAQLKWGIRGDLSFTHRTDAFSTATFLAGGNQLYDALNPTASNGPQQDVAGDIGPGVITLAGFNPAAPEVPVYPETPAYLEGTGVWPGATVTVDAPARVGASRLADQLSEYPYILQEQVSKYYVRRGGVSGRHVAEEASFDPDLLLYNYQFQLTRYQLTFLSNENERSWVNGTVVVPFPSDFKQSFRELMLTCTGALNSAEIDPSDSGPKDLAYWKGSFTPMVMRFAPEAGAGCYADRFLTLGLISGAANIDSPLAGTLAFKPDGNIGTLADNIEGADGRLGLPATVPLKGPGTETYALNPVTKLYFNNHTTTGAPGTGFVSFAATCAVPYFEDLRVHVMTSAQAGVPAPAFLASNWENGSQSHFSNTLFDPSHRGFPSDIAVGQYQNPTTVTFTPNDYRVRAKQSIFGIVPLDYPLRWSTGARYFESWEAEQDNLLVLQVEHQIDYLSADNAEISFGAKYDGLPKLASPAPPPRSSMANSAPPAL